MVRVKICGITNVADALAAAQLGADVIGLNLYKGPRRIDVERAKAIVDALPPFVSTVVLLGPDAAPKAAELCAQCRVHGVQLYGLESVDAWSEAVEPLGDRVVIKPIRVRDAADVDRIESFRADLHLLDAHVEGQDGGTGHTFDWSLAQQATRCGRIMLAGGLTPSNVAEAVRSVKPYAVDCASGVEASPGKKDEALMEEFIRNAKQAAGA